jgi:deoxyadenosine/deoxycytidine kinase
MPQKLLAVCGNIATGKTTLAEALTRTQHWACEFEPVDHNPYLEDFYRDMGRWALPIQYYFLSARAALHATASRRASFTILDRTIYEDAHIFARALHGEGFIADRELQTYWRLFQMVSSNLRFPDLVLYLRAPLTMLFDRIRNRARPFEQRITLRYLAVLDEFYEQWINSLPKNRIITFNAAEVDFRDHVQIDSVIEAIEKRLDEVDIDV